MIAKKRQYFGTDGIRGRVGTSPITPDFVLKLGWAIGKTLANSHNNKVLIGKDTRISGYMLESALEAGLSAAGVDILLSGPVPTPAIAYLTKYFQADAGIVISASHNPFYDNGIKFFGPDGYKLPDDVELAIEKKLLDSMNCVEAHQLGKAKRVDNSRELYITFCKEMLPYPLDLAKLKIVVDCANGAAYHIFPDILRQFGAELITLGISPNGLNINENCGATNTSHLACMVKKHQADVGIALDGDGDRLVMIDRLGDRVDGDQLLFIIARFLHQRGQLSGGVVGTLMSNLGLEQALAQIGIDFVRTDIGDRYVLSRLLSKGWHLGGESSGHIINLSMNTTGDGMMAALQILAAMVDDQQDQVMPLHVLAASMKKLPQCIHNIPFTLPIQNHRRYEITTALKETEKDINEQGRVLLRYSGTEPVIRLMVEGIDQVFIRKIADSLSRRIYQIVN